MVMTKAYRFWELPIFKDARGSLCPIDKQDLPFPPKRIYFVYGVKGLRGGHAHKKEKEIFVCIKGKFLGRIHDGKRFREFRMDHPGQALYSDALVWHEFTKFTPGAIMLAISSIYYDGGQGYIMSFDKFLTLCKRKFS